MARTIRITDPARRDTTVALERAPRPPRPRFVGPGGRPVSFESLIRVTEGRDHDALLAAHDGDPDALAQALVDGDPELDPELVGRKVGPSDRVYLRPDGTVLYAARALRVTLDPAGREVSRDDFVDVEATVDADAPLPWSGRLFPIADVVRRFALVRKVQLRHVDGLTFDFLRELAQTLAREGKMAFLGSGSRGLQPLIFQKNGSPYRGFLEGRVEGEGFRLVLHLSNLELKAPAPPEPAPPEPEAKA